MAEAFVEFSCLLWALVFYHLRSEESGKTWLASKSHFGFKNLFHPGNPGAVALQIDRREQAPALSACPEELGITPPQVKWGESTEVLSSSVNIPC